MNTKVLEYIIAIAEEKSISRAAERFYLSQPSLSRHLTNIESDIGAKIFARQNGELALTDAGKTYINSAQAILHIEKQTEEKLSAIRIKHQGGLRVVIFSHERKFFTRYILPKYNELHPNVPIEVITTTRSAALSGVNEEIFDLAILPFSSRRSIPHSTIIRHDESVVATPRDFSELERLRTHGFSFSCFENTPFLLVNSKSEYRHMEEDIMEQYNFTPKLVCEVDRFVTAHEMILNGFGCAFFPRNFLNLIESDLPTFSLVPPHRFDTLAITKTEPTRRELIDLIALSKEIFCKNGN